MDENSKEKQFRIAVISVHGVADQPRFQTQQAAANLLLTGVNSSHYSDFAEKQITIPQNAVKLAREIDLDTTGIQCKGVRSLHTTGLVNRLATFENSKIAYKPMASEQPSNAVEPMSAPSSLADDTYSKDELTEHEAMREQLQGFTHNKDSGTVDIKVLSGKRTKTETEDECCVDLYEMHWADLSRISNGFFSFLFEFYLLLFFLPRIGTQTLERSRPFDKHRGLSWKIAFLSHLIAEYLLVIVVPILHLCVLSIMVALLPLHFSHAQTILPPQLSVPFLLILIVIGGAIVLCLFKWGRKNDKLWHLYAFPVMLTMAAVVLIFVSTELPANWSNILTHLVFCLLLLMMLKTYNKRQPGAIKAGQILLLLTFLLTTAFHLNGGLTDSVVHLMASESLSENLAHTIRTGLDTASFSDALYTVTPQRIFFVAATALFVIANGTAIAITIFVFFAIVSFIASAWAADNAPESEKSRSSRLLWTSSTTLVISGLLSILITFSLWELLYRATQLLYGGYLGVEFVPNTLRLTLEIQFFPGMAYIAAIVLLATFYAGWAISPAPLSDSVKVTGDTRDLGNLLDRSFKQMNYSSWVLTFVLFFIIPGAALYKITENPVVQHHDHYVVLGLALIIVLLMFGQGPAATLKKGFGAVLDIALDVTNWFRVKPRKNNAKAAICRRYVSLLRYVSGWRDPDTRQPYDAVVIMAHSQGSVITADLLRFLVHEQEIGAGKTDDALSAFFPHTGKPSIPISLLTFGSPLRQLYNKRFPHQYGWCEPINSNNKKNGPDPESLGVDVWQNIYMSGDYVGRHLWFSDEDPARFDENENLSDTDKVSEKCAGFGGHTAYWTGKVSLVSDTLDHLIARVSTKVIHS